MSEFLYVNLGINIDLQLMQIYQIPWWLNPAGLTLIEGFSIDPQNKEAHTELQDLAFVINDTRKLRLDLDS